MLKKNLLLGALLSTALGLQVAVAQDGAALYAGKACLACHGADANTPINDFTPKLAGQNKAYLVQQMKDIASGARANGQTAQMKGIASALSDDEIEAISAYLSGL